jgi:hypothetical protein
LYGQIFENAAGVMMIRDQVVHFFVGCVVPFIAMIAGWGDWKVLPSVNLMFFFSEFLLADIVATIKYLFLFVYERC